MTAQTYRIDEENAREKRNKNFALAKAHIEQMHQDEDLQSFKGNDKSEIETRVDTLSTHISNKKQDPKQDPRVIADQIFAEFFAKPLPALPAKIDSLSSKIENSDTKPQILEMEKTTNPTIVPTLPQIEPTDEEPQILPPENLEEEAPVEDAKSESAQRKNLWDMWQEAADQLGIDLQDVLADPFESDAAQKVMLLCSHLASQMNHESARALLDFIEDTRLQNLKKAYQPGAKEIIPIVLQLAGALVGGFCGFVPAAAGYAGSQAKMWETASSVSNSFVSNGASSVGQMISTVNQGKHSVVGHELESDKRLQQDLQQRRQQAEQAAKRELENIVRMAQAKHETVRAINQA